MLRREDLLGSEREGLDEAPARLGEEVERTAEERHGPPYGLSTGKAGDGLIDDGLQDARRDVLPARPLVYEGLHVGLGEHSTAGRDGIDGGVVAGKLVQSARVGLEQSQIGR